MWRKRFKTIFPWSIIWSWKKSLAERLNCSEQEAEKNYSRALYKFPKASRICSYSTTIPLEHGGYINTMLGDKLKIQGI